MLNPTIIYYNNDDIANLRFNLHYLFANKEDLTLTAYEKCIIVDFVNFYLKNSYKDIICYYINLNYYMSIYASIPYPSFDIFLPKDDFKKNIIDNNENIKREYITALLCNIFLPYFFNKNNLIFDINNIKSINIYSDRSHILYWKKYNEYYNQYGIKNKSLPLHLQKKYSIDDYIFLDGIELTNIFTTLLFINSNCTNILLFSKVIVLKMNNNCNVYLVNNDNCKFMDIDNYIINNKFYEYLIEKEYYAEEIKNFPHSNFDYNPLFYLQLYMSINNSELLKYNNIIKPWLLENIYPYIINAYEYMYIGICKPINVYQECDNQIIHNQYINYINVIPEVKKAVDNLHNGYMNKHINESSQNN